MTLTWNQLAHFWHQEGIISSPDYKQTHTNTMASFDTSNNSVGRELSIASRFVRQYYTLLNKAPGLIHNFYSNDSTFIHGTIEMANEQHCTEPIMGREKIKRKMEDLKLNDCRAKIKQIDCLETLAGGLVIQVIGELSNNGRPMRRFLQTFVLAPGPEETRTDGDAQGPRTGPTDRRGVHLSDTNTSSSEKFFVLNSIFRYQDDGPENEFENDTASVHATASTEVDSGERVAKEPASKRTHDGSQADESQQGGAVARGHVLNVRASADYTKDAVAVERVTRDFERGTKLNRSQADQEIKQMDSGNSKVVINGTSKIDKKSETSDKPTENGHVADSNNSNQSGSIAATTATAIATATVTRTQPTNEPKTWANMVRNHPPTSSIQVNTSKPHVSEHPQNLNQQSAQAHQQQPPQASSLNSINNNNNSNNLGNNRRRHMMRKPANKATGRSIKNRQPRPPAQPNQQQPSQQGKPAA